MTDNFFNFDDFSDQVLDIITKSKLTPSAFGVAITLPKDEFEQIAEKYPNHVQQNLILITSSGVNGVQWYVQISKEMSFADISHE